MSPPSQASPYPSHIRTAFRQVMADHLKAVAPHLFQNKLAVSMKPRFGMDTDPASGKGKVGKEGELMAIDQSVRLVAELLYSKLRTDVTADQRGKAHIPFGKFVKDFLMRHYGMKLVADKALTDMKTTVIGPLATSH